MRTLALLLSAAVALSVPAGAIPEHPDTPDHGFDGGSVGDAGEDAGGAVAVATRATLHGMFRALVKTTKAIGYSGTDPDWYVFKAQAGDRIEVRFCLLDGYASIVGPDLRARARGTGGSPGGASTLSAMADAPGDWFVELSNHDLNAVGDPTPPAALPQPYTFSIGVDRPAPASVGC